MKSFQPMATFNPFTSRRARDIRNSLSKMFISALSQMDATPVRAYADQLLTEESAQENREFIHDRIQRYGKAIAHIRRLGLKDTIDQMVCLWNQGLFFEVHELLEEFWKISSGAKRRALQGMIKAASVYVHLEYGHQSAADKLAASSVDLLSQHRDQISFIANLEKFIEDLKKVNPVPTILIPNDQRNSNAGRVE
jgi:hypothetical protein